jgi:twitching motility two-component system response regulator PilH
MAKKALVVDDSPADLAAVKSILTDAGCVVVTAANGKEAVEKAKAEKPAIIFLDIIMPEMDGYETCRRLAEDAATKDIPVVFVTSKKEKADKVWGQMQGARGFLVKPVSADQVVDQIKAVA